MPRCHCKPTRILFAFLCSYECQLAKGESWWSEIGIEPERSANVLRIIGYPLFKIHAGDNALYCFTSSHRLLGPTLLDGKEDDSQYVVPTIFVSNYQSHLLLLYNDQK